MASHSMVMLSNHALQADDRLPRFARGGCSPLNARALDGHFDEQTKNIRGDARRLAT